MYPGAYDIIVSGGLATTTLFQGEVTPTEAPGQIRYAAQFPGSDVAAQINNALKDLPAQGGTVDARGLGGPSTAPATWSSDPFSGVTTQSVVLLDNFHRTTAALSLAVNAQGYWGTGRNQTQIQMDPTFPVSTPLVTINKAGGIFGCTLRDLALDCNGVTGSIGVLLSGAQEGSGLWRVQVLGAKDAGVRINSAGAGSQQWALYDVDCATVGAGTFGIDVGNSAGVGTIRRGTMSSSGGAGTAGIRLNTGSAVRISDIHAEQYTYGIQVTSTGGGAEISNVVGHSSLTSVVRIEAGSNGTVLCSNIVLNGATNTIDDQSSTPANTFNGWGGFYVVGGDAGRQRFSSNSNVAWKINNALTTTGLITGQAGLAISGAASSFAGGTLTVTGNDVSFRRPRADQGTIHVAGTDYGLSAGWGTSASLGIGSTNRDSRGFLQVTSGTAAFGANPTITLTYKDGTYGANAPFAVVCSSPTTSDQPLVPWTSSAGTTTAIFTWLGTPIASKTYSCSFVIMA